MNMKIGFSSTRAMILYILAAIIALAIIAYSIVIYCKDITDVIGMIALLIIVPVLGGYAVYIGFKIREGRFSEEEKRRSKDLESSKVVGALHRYLLPDTDKSILSNFIVIEGRGFKWVFFWVFLFVALLGLFINKKNDFPPLLFILPFLWFPSLDTTITKRVDFRVVFFIKILVTGLIIIASKLL